MFYESHRYKKIILLVLAALVAIIWYGVFIYEKKRDPQIIFFDVGQGDAVFIELPNGNQMLVDGGPGDSVFAKLGREMPPWDRSIDVLVLTHPHADHLSGLIEVINRYHIGMIVDAGAEYASSEASEWRRTIEKNNIPVVPLLAGDRVVLGGEAFFDVFVPFKNLSGSSPSNIHDASVAGRFSIKGASVLLMGDAEEKIEYRLVFFGYPLDADILKAGHHGSRTSTSEAFLRSVSPRAVVISSGRGNRYGHPHQEVIDRIHSYGATILRTDELGDIRMKFTGQEFAAE
ncbi:MAG: hypothetical protein A2847_01470 [Candidatus Sungbacteria bacterium RIFCSPHIGHO2_01_FULL_50_25]|uniref:Metallo-beta-lactamase domain-containing protein n=1 Tax=Candidatus Sungbacteria bacterium RIFCSPHIGHO2_01_FULL_50_25 TaxID=1802265 RepID=A0A1G2KAA7_9BACT|nr:MAG: hypothetical protein A2847_01470 [Candidatus Sungbacteria bacterium RIFCSPHIGHO2_01_FULL_50_25]